MDEKLSPDSEHQNSTESGTTEELERIARKERYQRDLDAALEAESAITEEQQNIADAVRHDLDAAYEALYPGELEAVKAEDAQSVPGAPTSIPAEANFGASMRDTYYKMLPAEWKARDRAERRAMREVEDQKLENGERKYGDHNFATMRYVEKTHRDAKDQAELVARYE